MEYIIYSRYHGEYWELIGPTYLLTVKMVHYVELANKETDFETDQIAQMAFCFLIGAYLFKATRHQIPDLWLHDCRT